METQKNEIDNKIEQRVGPDLHLGCGAKGPLDSGRTRKACADCGRAFEVNGDVLICPECEGPLG